MTYKEMAELQKLPYQAKVAYAAGVIENFEREVRMSWAGSKPRSNTHVSVGGLDSITLFLFIKSLGYKVPGISVSTLEDRSIQEALRALGLEVIKPYKSKVQVIQEFGFPVISKAKASKIHHLQNPESEKQTFIRAIMTGEMGRQGHFGHSDKLKLPDKWIALFGGNYQKYRPDLPCKTAPFPVSSVCCKWMKEKPCDDWAKAHDSAPYLGLMACEGGQREHGLVKNGCNYYGKSVVRSCPFNIFTRQDLLRLALDLHVPVPRIYGEIREKPDGTLYTTRAQRTGCSMCGFGIHIEKRPHRFDRLREDNPKEWEFWMYRCYKSDDGSVFGWGKVLDYIGVPWEDPYVDWGEQQVHMAGFGEVS